MKKENKVSKKSNDSKNKDPMIKIIKRTSIYYNRLYSKYDYSC